MRGVIMLVFYLGHRGACASQEAIHDRPPGPGAEHTRALFVDTPTHDTKTPEHNSPSSSMQYFKQREEIPAAPKLHKTEHTKLGPTQSEHSENNHARKLIQSLRAALATPTRSKTLMTP